MLRSLSQSSTYIGMNSEVLLPFLFLVFSTVARTNFDPVGYLLLQGLRSDPLHMLFLFWS
jgi:hypothetical protein